MMSEDMANFIRREVYRVHALHARPRVGLVSGYDPDNHAVKVQLQPEGNETGWIPLETLHIGNGYGVAIGPEIGDQLEITFQGGDPEVPRVTGRIFSDKEKPPKVEAGEVLVKHKSGTQILIDKDGKATVKSKGAAVVFADGAVTVQSQAAVHLHAPIITSSVPIVVGEGGHTAAGEK